MLHRNLLSLLIGRIARGRLERHLLYAPILHFADVQFVLRRACHFMRPVELAYAFADRSEPADQMAVEIELVHMARGAIARVEVLFAGPWSDTDEPRRAHVAERLEQVQIRV